MQGEDVIAVMPNADKRIGRARPDQMIHIFEKMTPLGMIYDAAIAFSDGVKNKTFDPKTFQQKFQDVERLRKALPAIGDEDALLPAETESYRKILDTSLNVLKQYRNAISATLANPHAAELVAKGTTQLTGTVKAEMTWLQNRAVELKQKQTPK